MTPRNKVSLEELLRLKRAERPDPEFWTRFEAELRVRQLAAIVEKRPWWDPLSRAWQCLLRAHLPWGASAAAAVALAVVWQQRGADAQRPVPPAHESPFVAEVSSGLDGTVPYTQESVPEEGQLAQAEGEAVPAYTPAVSPGSLTPLVPWVGEAVRSREENGLRMSEALAVEASFAEAGLLELDLGPALGVNHGFEARALPAMRGTVEEPLAAIPSPREARRQRLMASLASVSGAERGARDRSATAQVRDRLTRRLSEDELYDSVSRLSGGGDRLTVKF